tara:strand:- start:615 stop:1181 length:567 start_codon:yes stop_codon:yes gene_type:complete
MDSNYIKYGFSNITIKKDVATQFRMFSKQLATSNTDTLDAMLRFFEINDLSPHDDLGINNQRTNKRINAVIAILKNIEKYQTKPTATMLQKLFEETSIIEEEENQVFEGPNPISENEALEYYRNAYDKTQTKYQSVMYELQSILDKITYVKGSFGPGYFKLDMDKTAYGKLKTRIHHVHHNNTAENRW